MAVGLVIESTLICGATWLLWRIFRQYVVKSPLDNIPGPAPPSLWSGNFGQFFNRHGWAFRQELAEKYGPVVKFTGFFGDKYLFVYDPKALHNIIIKDQYDYEESSWFIASNLLIFGPGLLGTLGNHHRKQRKLLNPVFSINHMRHMTPIFYDVVHRLRTAITAQVKDSPKEIDMLRWMGRTALELVGQGGLGYSFDPLVEDVPNEFGDALKNLVPTLFSLSYARFATPFLIKLGPPGFRRWLAAMLPGAAVHQARSIINSMDTRSWEIYREKKAALEKGDEAVSQQVAEGKDIMSILLQANMTATEDEKLDEKELVAQMTTLVFAATDTTSSALSQILQLLAKYPAVQDKLRKEILEARDGQDIPYDQLVELPYMDAICRESLRLYPPVNALMRETRKDVIMPLSEPIRGVDGTLIHEVPIPNNTGIIVGIHASNTNKAIWGEDANEFKPERWLSPLPDSVTNAHIPGVYSNLMTFLGGGRACIGFKFSQLEMKVVLSVLVEAFRFSLPKNEIVWNIGGVKYPTVSKKDTKPALPMKVELIK